MSLLCKTHGQSSFWLLQPQIPSQASGEPFCSARGRSHLVPPGPPHQAAHCWPEHIWGCLGCCQQRSWWPSGLPLAVLLSLPSITDVFACSCHDTLEKPASTSEHTITCNAHLQSQSRLSFQQCLAGHPVQWRGLFIGPSQTRSRSASSMFICTGTTVK